MEEKQEKKAAFWQITGIGEEKKQQPFIVLINTSSSFTVRGSFGSFLSNQSVSVIFLRCKQILETLISTGEIINVLSACNHLLSKNKSVCLALYCNQHSSDVVSVTAAFDKQVDNCDNVTGANEIFNKMSAE